MAAYRSRWGYHPCDYETYQLLKRLNVLYVCARRLYAAWQRWARKKPHNRVVRHTLRDGQGRKVGSRVVGVQPEPRLCPVFCREVQIHRRHCDAQLDVGVAFHAGCGIPEAYRAARTPVATADMVGPLPCSLEDVHALAARAREVYGGRWPVS
jgi:hypothetical protein